jgi:hypothetical protein
VSEAIRRTHPFREAVLANRDLETDHPLTDARRGSGRNRRARRVVGDPALVARQIGAHAATEVVDARADVARTRAAGGRTRSPVERVDLVQVERAGRRGARGRGGEPAVACLGERDALRAAGRHVHQVPRAVEERDVGSRDRRAAVGAHQCERTRVLDTDLLAEETPRAAGRTADPSFVGRAVAVVVAAVADLRHRRAGHGADAARDRAAERLVHDAVAVVVDHVAGLGHARAAVGVRVVAVVADRTTGWRARAGERAGRTHVHGAVAVVIAIVVAALVDRAVAVVVEVVADLHAGGRAGGATVVDRAVAVVVDRVAADLGHRRTGDRTADGRGRRTCGAGRRTESLAGTDACRAACATARATRIGAADAACDDAALLATAIGRAEVGACVEVAAREAAEAVREHDARLADAAGLVGTYVVGTGDEAHAEDDRDGKERTVDLHHLGPQPFSRSRESENRAVLVSLMTHHLG